MASKPPPKPPSLTVVEPAPPGGDPRVLMAPTLEGSRKGYAPTDAPIAAAVTGTPGVTRWRVMRDVGGERAYIGTIATYAQPEALIDALPGAMPLPGQIGLYFLRGLSTENKDTGHEFAFRISGDSPEVQAARARLVGTAPGAAPVASSLVADAHVAELKRQTEAIALERRTLADQRVADEKARADVIKAEAEAKILIIREEAKTAREAEAARREQDRKDMEQRLIEDRTRQDTRDAAAEKAREALETLRKEERAAEKERDREHRERMAAIASKSSLEGTLTTVLAVTTALGIKPKELLDRVTGGGAEAGKGTPEVIAETVSAGFSEFGQTLRLWMELQHGVKPSGGSPEKKAPAQLEDRNAPTDAEEVKPRGNPKLDGVPVAVQRKARNAMRDLLAELAGVPKEQLAAKALAAANRTPAILTYAKAIGVKAMCVEAGMTEADAATVEAAVPPSMLA